MRPSNQLIKKREVIERGIEQVYNEAGELNLFPHKLPADGGVANADCPFNCFLPKQRENKKFFNITLVQVERQKFAGIGRAVDDEFGAGDQFPLAQRINLHKLSPLIGNINLNARILNGDKYLGMI